MAKPAPWDEDEHAYEEEWAEKFADDAERLSNLKAAYVPTNEHLNAFDAGGALFIYLDKGKVCSELAASEADLGRAGDVIRPILADGRPYQYFTKINMPNPPSPPRVAPPASKPAAPPRPKGVSAFLSALWSMAAAGGAGQPIQWSDDGTSVIITDREAFEACTLPQYLSCSMEGFLRSINLYNFDRVRRPDGTTILSHPLFVRSNPASLAHIKRTVRPRDAPAGTRSRIPKAAAKSDGWTRALEAVEMLRSLVEAAAGLGGSSSDGSK